MWRTVLMGAVTAGALAVPRPAAACTCESGYPDLQQAFAVGLEGADVIFRGRTSNISNEDPATHRQQFTFAVSETFKGPALKKRVLENRMSGSCATSFEVGVEYLVYANSSDGRFSASYCSRTQRSADAALELEWLRNRKPVAPPVAARQQTVSCTECDVTDVTSDLVCGGTDCAALPLKDVAAAIEAGKPFWSYAERDPSTAASSIFGISADGGRPFTLHQEYPRHRCTTQVTQQWCASFKLSGRPGDRPKVQCIGATAARMPCDESASRTVKWSAPGSMSALTCEWKWGGAAQCELSGPLTPLAENQPTAPGLHCRPGTVAGWNCTRVPDAAAKPESDVPR